MDNNEAREILIAYVEWRHGGESAQPIWDTKIKSTEFFFEAIDCAIQALGEPESIKPYHEHGNSVASDRTESGQSADGGIAIMEILQPIHRHPFDAESGREMEIWYTHKDVWNAMTIYASQVCADKEREMGLLKNELAKAKEEIEKSHMDKIYSIHDLKSELSAANESLTVMVRKNAELLESVRPDVVVPSEKEVKSDLIYHSYLDGKNKGWNECLSELRRLNPTIAFTELNHEK